MKTVNSQPPTPQFSPLALGLALVLGAFTGFAFAADDANNTSRNKTTTHWVTKTADTNDGACDQDCSLREAIAVG